ncbi:hypothetical protein TEA_014324 [Camellia sinensis var. sinensis]|uniref:O-fucosyltransferase family protein n=1 Tax=Camellia sinensis var. sinensis TaxID=542762 RepID=A0A4S4EDM9_CAMSN|nr:hypothetical protein TEA_014324 [Camellia sinensis var. sinensis]
MPPMKPKTHHYSAAVNDYSGDISRRRLPQKAHSVSRRDSFVAGIFTRRGLLRYFLPLLYVSGLIMYLSSVWRYKRKLKEQKPCPKTTSGQKFGPSMLARYLVVEANGGLNQQRSSICNAVAVAGLLNVTLVIPYFELHSVWRDPRQETILVSFPYCCFIIPTSNIGSPVSIKRDHGKNKFKITITSFFKSAAAARARPACHLMGLTFRIDRIERWTLCVWAHS